jgi:cytochrome c oxidase assembly factor CtaG
VPGSGKREPGAALHPGYKLLPTLFVLAPSPALAHDEAWSITSGWNLDPWLALPLLVSALLYALGVGRLWTHAGIGRGVRPWQALCFAAGWVTLVVALLSPLYRLGEGLFVAHMLEHELVMVVAAPLIALARPFGGMVWALPARWRIRVGGATRRLASTRVWLAASNAWAATALQAVALWLWHAPALYNLVLVDTMMHRLQHLSFFLTALLFWWSLASPRMRRAGYGVAVLCLFVTVLHSGLLGALLTVSKHLWYARQAVLAAQWGLTPLEDQQLAGLLMWIPAGLIYTAAALAFAGLWIARTAKLAGDRHAALAR